MIYRRTGYLTPVTDELVIRLLVNHATNFMTERTAQLS